MKFESRSERRVCRHIRLRKKVSGTAERPRMAIMVSNKHIHVQFIDDVKGVTLASVTTQNQEADRNVASAVKVGERAVAMAVEKGIKKVTVDRGGLKFHGRVKAVVEAAVKAGLVSGGSAAVQEEK